MSVSPIHTAIDDLREAFEEFKKTNDERLAQLEKGIEDPLVDTKLANIDNALSRIQEQLQKTDLQAQRPTIGAESSAQGLVHKRAFLDYVRKGDDQELRLLEKKSMTANPLSAGGYLLPDALAKQIYAPDLGHAPMRDLATVVQTNSHQYELILGDTSQKALWGEEAIAGKAKDGTDTPKLERLVIPVDMLFYLPIISRTLLSDVSIDLESWLIEEMHKGLARHENAAFITGTGQNMPKGILSYAHSAEGGQEMFQSLSTGVAGGFPERHAENILIDALHMLKPTYLENTSWVMSRSALAAVRKLRTPDGHYLWQPPLSADMRTQTLLGYPIVVSDDMPQLDGKEGGIPIMVGDFREAYVIVDRETTVQRDELTCKPNLQLLVTKRVGGRVRNFDAVKFISCQKK